MIVSVHIADIGARAGLGVLAKRPRAEDLPGLRYAETVFTAPLGSGLFPAANPGVVGLIAAWDDEAALDRFDAHPLSQRLSGGWQVRLQPLRVFGAWPQMAGLPERPLAVDDDEPVAVLTLGRVLPWRLLPFLRSAAPAESEAIAEPDLLASTGFGRLPRLVSTFSLWRTAAGMREYAQREGGGHRAAVTADRARPFHGTSAFIRFRPFASSGSWGGRDPLATLSLATP